MRTVACQFCGRTVTAWYADAISEGWRCGGFAPLWWACPSCAAVDDAVEREVDDAIDRRSAS